MSRAKQASKRKSRACAVPLLGVVVAGERLRGDRGARNGYADAEHRS